MAEPVRLLDLPDDVRNSHLFRQGFNLGYEQGMKDKRARESAEYDAGAADRIRNHIPPPPPPPVYAYNILIKPGQLEPGVIVYRELDRQTRTRFTAPMPCCADPVTVVGDGREPVRTLCARCGAVYLLCLTEEPDEGYGPSYLAQFTVEHTELIIARRRRGNHG